jgi:hypothetical protein
VELLKAACHSGMAAGEDRTVAAAMAVCIRRHAEDEDSSRSIFIEGLAYFRAQQRASWVNEVWFRVHDDDFVQRLSGEVHDQILENLVHVPRIDFHAEEVLRAAAEFEPAKLLHFFELRLAREEALGEDSERYQAIPWDFHQLGDLVAPHAAEFVMGVRRLFEKESSALFEYKAGALIPRLLEFPLVEAALRQLGLSGTEEDAEYVLNVLRGYKGDPAIVGLCRDIVARANTEGPLLSLVEFALDQSDVVHGEFGMVELYQRRRTDMEPWLNDPDDKVRTFSNKRIRSLELQIRAEQRRSMEELELRKREYGE